MFPFASSVRLSISMLELPLGLNIRQYARPFHCFGCTKFAFARRIVDVAPAPSHRTLDGGTKPRLTMYVPAGR